MGHKISIFDLVDFFSKCVVKEQTSLKAHFLQIDNSTVQNYGP